MNPDAEELIEAALARGIITSEQRDRIAALAREDDARAAPSREVGRATAVEAPRGFNAITVAYIVGALLVLFAFGWFLIERWEVLGPTGVLAVSLVYTVLFALVARTLRRLHFDTAGGAATLLAVAMTPVWAWALLRLAGLWPDPGALDATARYRPFMATRWMVVELATIGAALVALRRVRFAPLALAIGSPLAFLVPHLVTALSSEELIGFVEGRSILVAGTALFLLGYALDRRGGDEDYAAWIYAAALVACTVGYMSVWDRAGSARHALAPIAVLLMTAALYLRRRLFLAAGLLAAFGYLGWLAFDVFRRVLNFPVVLATFGLVVIIATVWLQRRYPSLVSRVSGTGERRPDLVPGGWYAAAGPLVIAVALLVAGIPEARERASDAAFRERLMRKHWAREEAKARKAARGSGR